MSLSGFTPVEEMIHGVLVRDPHRWLEDRSSPQTQQWIAAQQRRYEAYFAGCSNLDSLRERVREYLDIEVVDQPARVAGKYFYRRRKRGEEQGSIHVRDVDEGGERLLLDPLNLGSFMSIGIHRVSEDGSLLACELKCGGEDKKALRIVEVETGRLLRDGVETGYARGFAFAPRNLGFFYCCQSSTEAEEHVIRLHLFDEASTDQEVFRVARACFGRLVLITDGVHLGAVFVDYDRSLADFWIAEQNRPFTWMKVFSNRTLPYNPMLAYGRIFAVSSESAPNGKFVELTQNGSVLRTIIPEQSGVIRQLIISGQNAFVSYLHNVVPSIHSWNLAGRDLGDLETPGDGTIQLLPSQSRNENGFFYSYESLDRPPAIFEYRVDIARSCLWHERFVPGRCSSCDIDEVSLPSRDGISISMTLATRRSVAGRTPVPVVMTSYGGFGVAMTKQFSVLASIIMELGGLLAVPHIRGGSDFGSAWHEAARGQRRQTAFDDFIASAEWLIKQNITAPDRLAVFGGSNSGLLAGVALTQRPDLFHAVLCIAPLLDMVRYEWFDQAAKWRIEFGTVASPEDFRVLYSYSPYHVRADVDYPAVLFVSGDKDERCNPAHVRKMVAALQGREAQVAPIIVDYSAERGHSPALPLSVRIEALARRIAFLCRELDIPVTRGRYETVGV